MKLFIALLGVICIFKASYASSIYAVVQDGQILFKNRPTFFRNLTNNKYQKSYIKELIQASAAKYNVNEKFVMAIAKAESGFNHNALSAKGAIGVMQIIPSTASLLNINPNNLEQNINGGVKYLKFLLNRYSGNYALAAAAYNSGPNNVDKYNGIPPFPETVNYVRTVMNYFDGTSPVSASNYYTKRVKIAKRPLKIVEENGVYTNIPHQSW